MTDVNIYKGEFCISTDKVKLDIDAVHEFLSTKAYWCINIPKDKVQTAIENSWSLKWFDTSHFSGKIL